jgi:hypothetical protein
MSDLDQLSDRELSEVFAVEVAGWKRFVEKLRFVGGEEDQVRFRPAGRHDEKGYWSELPVDYATDANAVLPHLEQMGFCTADREPHLEGWPWYVAVAATLEGDDPLHSAIAPTFARAACVALIKAKRTETTK